MNSLMKNCLGLFAVALSALLLAAGQGLAAFDTGSLVQVVYKSDDVEVGTDLLDLMTFDLTQKNAVLAPAGTVNLDQFVTTDDWGDLRVGYFGYDGTYVFFATTQETAPSVIDSSWSSFLGATDGVLLYYDTLGAGPTVIGLPTQFSSYWVKMDSATTPGQYAGLNSNDADGEAVLEALNTAGNFVDLYLYKFERVSRDVILVPGASADYQAVLRVRSDGSTILNPAAAPFGLVSPANGAQLSSAPAFDWTAGSYNAFGLYLILPIYGKYYVIPIWLYDTSLDLSLYPPLWSYVTKNSWGGWAVVGVDTTVQPPLYEVAGPWWFKKVGP